MWNGMPGKAVSPPIPGINIHSRVSVQSPEGNHALVQTTDVLEFGGVPELPKITGTEMCFLMKRDSILTLMMDIGGYGGRMGQQWS